MTYLSCPDAPAATDYATVHIAWELSKADWKLGVLLPGAQQMSRFTVKGAIWPRPARGLRRRAPRRPGAGCR
jgi:transposase